jgi:hypothetical protein
MWVVEPGDKIVVSRTAVIPSKKLSKREFRVLEEIVNIYSKMLENVLPHASSNIIESYYRLKNEKYHEQGISIPISHPTMLTEFVRMRQKGYPL